MPHDLLKSYHLREMTRDPEALKLKIIETWENANQNELEDLFKTYLFPATQWYKNHSGLNYSTHKIAHFKGIRQSNANNYAVYHKAANLFLEQMNNNGSTKLYGNQQLNQFQLTQPIIAGRRFFQWTLHYQQLLEQVQGIITAHFGSGDARGLLPNQRAGDIYIKQLFEIVLVFFADRFGIAAIDTAVLNQFYTWCYSLRLRMKAVYQATVNNYAIGNHEKFPAQLDMFAKISEMSDPNELKEIVFQPLNLTSTEANAKYSAILSKLQHLNGWAQ